MNPGIRRSLLIVLCVIFAWATGRVSGQDAKEKRTVTIEYIAHACFRVTSPAGKQVLIDPYASRVWLGYDFPPNVHADAVYDAYLTLPAVDIISDLLKQHQPTLLMLATTYDLRDIAARLNVRHKMGLITDATDLQFEGDTLQITVPWGGENVVDRGLGPGKRVVRPHYDLAHADLRYQVAQPLRGEDHRVVIELLQVFARLLVERLGAPRGESHAALIRAGGI